MKNTLFVLLLLVPSLHGMQTPSFNFGSWWKKIGVGSVIGLLLTAGKVIMLKESSTVSVSTPEQCPVGGGECIFPCRRVEGSVGPDFHTVCCDFCTPECSLGPDREEDPICLWNTYDSVEQGIRGVKGCWRYAGAKPCTVCVGFKVCRDGQTSQECCQGEGYFQEGRSIFD